MKFNLLALPMAYMDHEGVGHAHERQNHEFRSGVL